MLLADLAAYNVRYVPGDQVQQLWVEALEGASRDMCTGREDAVELPTFAHKSYTIRYPDTSRPLPRRVQQVPHLTAFFYGGAAQKLGTGGYIVFD